MILTSSNLAHYLHDQGFVTAASLVDGDFIAVDVSRRNRNFKVLRKDGPSYFVKQVQSWDQQSITTLRCEATCYWLAQHEQQFAALAELMPHFCSYDPQRHVLITELVPQAETVAEYLHRVGSLPPEVATLLGQGLGLYHREAGPQIQQHPQQSAFPSQTPWILSIHQHRIDLFQSLSAANTQLLAIVQRYPAFQQTLDRLRSRWQGNSLIHGDIKWDNCIIYHDGEQPGALQLKIVDWELASIGDACWDVGAIFQAFLSTWLLSMPLGGEALPGQLVQQARYPLEGMQPAIHAFWQRYITTLEVIDEARRELLERSTLYAAARMIQTAYEYLYRAPQMTAQALYLLQVSLNMLQSPDEAISQLLGL